MSDTKKRDVLIVSYYLSRCNEIAVKKLGYNTFTEAFQKLGEVIDEKPNNIKNVRDEFDPYFDNGRRGWYQRELRGSRKEIFEEMSILTDDQVGVLAKQIINKYAGVKMKNDIEILKDLRAMIRQSSLHYNQDFVWQDVVLTQDFKYAYEEYLEKNKAKIEYNTATSVITTSSSKYIFVPNQWFVMASYATGVHNELHKYKAYLESVCNCEKSKFDVFAKKLRDETIYVDKKVFLNDSKKAFLLETNNDEVLSVASNRLWRFATDYSWWSGQKTVDRGDFYYSVVLNMLNLVNASQGYVAEIVNAYGCNPKLLSLTKDLGQFTENLVGSTYDIHIEAEDIDDVEFTGGNPVTNGSTRHKITISSSSIKKIGGK